VWFSALTIAVGASLWFVRGTANSAKATPDSSESTVPASIE